MEFFRGWPPARILDYVRGNYRMDDFGLTLRHNPVWEADIVESQPASGTISLLSLPAAARAQCAAAVVFGEHSPFNSLEAQILLRTAFPDPKILGLEHAGHMLVFQKEQPLVDLVAGQILDDGFLSTKSRAI
jgi:hypothetical protein